MKSIAVLFREYVDTLNKKSNRKSDAILAENMLEQVESSNDDQFVAALEDQIRYGKSKKEKKYGLVLEFYDFYKEKTGKTIDTDLAKHIIIDDVNLRRFEMIRYFQDHKCKAEEIAEVFMLDRRTASSDLRALEDGISILDSEVQLKLKRDGWKYYTEQSTHPVLLNLDMPEVVAMTVGLMKAGEEQSLYAPQFRRIAKDVYDSLSDYAKGRILNYMKDQNVESEFTKEMEQYERQLSSDMLTMLKSGCPGTLKLSWDDKDYIFSDCHISLYDENQIEVLTAEGDKRKFPVEAVFSCEYHLEREFNEEEA